MLTMRARRLARPTLDPVVRMFVRFGVGPNVLTIAGVWLHLPVVWLLVHHSATWPAGCALAAAGLFDALDGTLARATGRTTPFGAFLDSVMDRVSEALVCFGLLLRARAAGDWTLAGWTFVLIVGSMLVSYTRARAAGIGVDTQVGWLGRLERILLLIGGLLTGWLLQAVVVTAVGAWLTALARLVDVWRRSRPGAGTSAAAATAGDERTAVELRA